MRIPTPRHSFSNIFYVLHGLSVLHILLLIFTLNSTCTKCTKRSLDEHSLCTVLVARYAERTTEVGVLGF